MSVLILDTDTDTNTFFFRDMRYMDPNTCDLNLTAKRILKVVELKGNGSS